jgi:hypothetical protein
MFDLHSYLYGLKTPPSLVRRRMPIIPSKALVVVQDSGGKLTAKMHGVSVRPLDVSELKEGLALVKDVTISPPSSVAKMINVEPVDPTFHLDSTKHFTLFNAALLDKALSFVEVEGKRVLYVKDENNSVLAVDIPDRVYSSLVNVRRVDNIGRVSV